MLAQNGELSLAGLASAKMAVSYSRHANGDVGGKLESEEAYRKRVRNYFTHAQAQKSQDGRVIVEICGRSGNELSKDRANWKEISIAVETDKSAHEKRKQ